MCPCDAVGSNTTLCTNSQTLFTEGLERCDAGNHTATVNFFCCFRDPRGLLSRERDMFRRQTSEVRQPLP